MKANAPKYFLSAVLVIKDEATYLAEWIDYHAAVGVEHFYIYDNDSTDNIRDVLAPYIKSGRVTYTFWPGRGQQRAEYADWHKNYSADSRWAAIIDVDEFIVPRMSDNIRDFLRAAPDDCGQVYIGYNNFGSGGYATRPRGRVMESYVWRDNGCDNLLVGWPWSDSGKCIIRPALIHTVDIHFHVMQPGAQTYNANMAPYDIENRDRDNKLPRDRMTLNHYGCKSRAEFFEMRARRGFATSIDCKHTEEFFKSRDTNFIFDEAASILSRRLRRPCARLRRAIRAMRRQKSV